VAPHESINRNEHWKFPAADHASLPSAGEPRVIALLIKLLVGAGLGLAWVHFRRGKFGAGSLSADWTRGALYGAVLGLLFHFISGGGSYPTPQHVKTIGEADFDAEVLRAGQPVVVDFYATWCGPCKVLSPRLDKLAVEFGDRIKFVAVDVDQSPTLAAKYNVQGIPTLLFFSADGAVRETSVGLLSVEVLRAKLESLLK
jgi:thioredoxin 1